MAEQTKCANKTATCGASLAPVISCRAPIIYVLVLLGAGLLSPASASGVDDGLFGPRDIFELEIATDPQISPDGRRVAYVRRTSDLMSDSWQSSIWTIADDGSDHRAILSGDANYSSPRWSPSGDRMAYLASAEGKGTQLFMRWMDGGEATLLAKLPEAPEHISWSADGRHIAFSMFVPSKDGAFVQSMPAPEGAQWAPPVMMTEDPFYRVDGEGVLRSGNKQIFITPAEGGTPIQLTSGAFDHAGPLSWAPDGRELFFSANRNDDWKLDSEELDVWAVDIDSRQLRRLTKRKGMDANAVVSPDGKKVAYLGYEDERLGFHTANVSVMNRDGSGETIVPTQGLDRSIDAVAWNGSSKLIVQYDDHGKTTLAHLGLNGKLTPIVQDLGGVGVTRPYTSGSFSVSGNVIAYTQGNAQRPSDLAIVKGRGRSRRLTNLNEDLFAHRKLAGVERFSWASSADGREIEGWLVKPPNFDPTAKYPFILEIHGGPFGAYGPQFSAEIQRYAAEGYVVLYANPRGSTSYGNAFANLIHHNYPGQDYDDLMSGVDAVIELGYVDSENLFVTGGSGGGLLTAWIVGKTNRFKAAVSAKPVVNMISFALTSDYANYFYLYWFDKTPWEDPEAYWARSPLSLVGNVTTPTMLMAGEADLRTPSSEAEQFYHALRLRGVDAALVIVPEAYHFIAARPSHLNAKVDHILAWFERYRSE